MDGTKMARIRRCRHCEFRRSASSEVWRWPHCTADGGDMELDNAAMETGRCPIGRWDALVPVDMAALEAEQLAKAQARERSGIAPVLAAMLGGLPEQDKGERLTIAVQHGIVSPTIATEIMEGKVAPALADSL